MYELIVLGLIPGTHIQITFTLWLAAAGVLSSLVLLWILLRLRGAIGRAIVTLALARHITRYSLHS